jgi:hypothetical protein
MPEALKRPFVGDLEVALGDYADVYHECGGKLSLAKKWMAFAYFSESVSCDRCKHSWKIETVRKFTPRDLADRFFVCPKPDFSSIPFVLVRVYGEGKRAMSHTSVYAQQVARKIAESGLGELVRDPTAW